jgi:hypothetical protein
MKMEEVLEKHKDEIAGFKYVLLLKDSQNHHCFLYRVDGDIALQYPDNRCPIVYPTPNYEVVAFSTIKAAFQFLRECPSQTEEIK